MGEMDLCNMQYHMKNFYNFPFEFYYEEGIKMKLVYRWLFALHLFVGIGAMASVLG